MAAYDHCQSEEFQKAASPITGNHIHVNLSYDKVYIPRDMDLGLAQRIGAELPAFWEKQASETGNSWKSSREMRAAYYAFAEVRTYRLHVGWIRCFSCRWSEGAARPGVSRAHLADSPVGARPDRHPTKVDVRV
jgi:hypothetical protein